MNLEQCNNLLRRELGETPSRQARFQWFRASQLDLFARLSGYDQQPTGGLVSLVVPRWRRIDWTGPLGGDVWVVAMWHPPMPRHQWDASIGAAFPYPSRGSYIPVNGAVLPLGDEPDEARTLFAIGRLKIDLAKTYQDRKRELDGILEKEKSDMQNMTEEWVANEFTAFLSVPGEKGHTAFQVPGLRNSKEKQVETMGT